MSGDGIERLDLGPFRDETLDDFNGWGFAHIVGLGFEREPENCDCLVPETIHEVLDFGNHTQPLFIIRLDHRVDYTRLHSESIPHLCKGLCVFRETRPAEAWSGM